MGLIVGEIYAVPCAELRWRDDGRTYYIPVFDHFHADAQFGFPDLHYHIDGRFELEPRMRQYFKISDGQTSSVIIANGVSYKLVRIVSRSTLCIAHATGLRVPESGDHADLYRQWYQSYVGKKCAGRKCPHFGTEMLERDGRLICPMHGLSADLTSLRII